MIELTEMEENGKLDQGICFFGETERVIQCQDCLTMYPEKLGRCPYCGGFPK